MFHQSGGCCDGSAPMCYPSGDFRVGPQDVLLGKIAGCDFYIGAAQFEYWQHTQLIIDVVPDVAPGFPWRRRRGQVPDAQPRVHRRGSQRTRSGRTAVARGLIVKAFPACVRIPCRRISRGSRLWAPRPDLARRTFRRSPRCGYFPASRRWPCAPWFRGSGAPPLPASNLLRHPLPPVMKSPKQPYSTGASHFFENRMRKFAADGSRCYLDGLA